MACATRHKFERNSTRKGKFVKAHLMVELFSGAHLNLYVCDGDQGLTDVDVAAIIKIIKNAEPDLILAGTFVETSYTLEHIERTIEEEKRLGIRDDPCAFLGDLSADGKNEQMSKTISNSIVAGNNKLVGS